MKKLVVVLTMFVVTSIFGGCMRPVFETSSSSYTYRLDYAPEPTYIRSVYWTGNGYYTTYSDPMTGRIVYAESGVGSPTTYYPSIPAPPSGFYAQGLVYSDQVNGRYHYNTWTWNEGPRHVRGVWQQGQVGVVGRAGGG